MAAHIAQRWCLLCRRAGINAIPLHAELRSVSLRDIRKSLQLSLSYGTRERDTAEVSQNRRAVCELFFYWFLNLTPFV